LTYNYSLIHREHIKHSKVMNHYTQYLSYHVGLLQEFKASTEKQPPFINDTPLREEDQALVDTLNLLCDTTQYSDHTSERGQWFVGRIVSAYSHLMPLLPRDLLWFFGGDCLHYMPDEEIDFYQQLDELRFTAEEADKPFDYAEAKRTLGTQN